MRLGVSGFRLWRFWAWSVWEFGRSRVFGRGRVLGLGVELRNHTSLQFGGLGSGCFF